MNYLDEFRDPALAGRLLSEIRALAGDRPLKVMEICGGHTHAIYRHGLDQLLPPNIELVHGPGCPVCVIPLGRMDDALALARQEGVIFASYGDMLAVPGSQGSLTDARAAGADVRFVYSPLDALKLARQHPERQVIFLAVGFETTAPATALTLLQAAREEVTNLSFFVNHVLIMPAMRALLDSPNLSLDGFIGPGHVSTVIGLEPYRVIPEEYRKPIVVAGFEPLDILQALLMLLRQLADGRCEVENQYGRAVTATGNPTARAVLSQTMEPREEFEWRGLGVIPRSALRLRDDYAAYDAERRFTVPGLRLEDPKACQCGQVLRGVLKPWQCKVFGTACTPETPIGTCMVSPEGACAAYYNYGRLSQR
jgi:hydrogenase expression/formation protein HypD